MFVDLLNGPQQRVLVEAVRAIAAADGTVQEVEAEVVAAVIREGNALTAVEPEGEFASQEQLVEAVKSAFESEDSNSPARRAFVTEIAGLVTIDGDENEDELRVLSALMDAAGVASSELESFLGFGRAAASLADQGATLVLNTAGSVS